MSVRRKEKVVRWWYQKNVWLYTFAVLLLSLVRISKGAVISDLYAFFSRPFWPGSAQKEWIQNGINLENQIKLDLLQKDNNRLRGLLSLKSINKENQISAAVISRKVNGFWHQLYLNKGSLDGIKIGDPVVGPGGLLGIIDSTTSTTSKVRLLTSPTSKVGVWIERTKVHGVLVGNSTNRPQLNFLDRNPEVKLGDVISTSPASTLMPPNLSVGVVQSINSEHLPAPYAFVQLLATPEAIDWVQVISWQ